MKTFNKNQFIKEFGDKKVPIAFVRSEGVCCAMNITGVKDIWGLINLFSDEAVFDVYSFSAGLSNENVLQRTFNEKAFGYYQEKYFCDYRNLEDNGDDLFVVLIRDYYALKDGIVARHYPYEVTAEMIRCALGKTCCKMLDLREKKVRGVYQRIETSYFYGRTNYATRQEARAVVEQKVKEYQSYIRGVLRRCKDIDIRGLSLEEGVKAWLKYQKQLKKEQEKEQKAREKAEEKARKVYEAEQKRVCLCIDGYDSVRGFIMSNLRTGEHTGAFSGHIANKNSIVCDEERDFDGYSRSCTFPMIRRFFTLNIKKGFRVCNVGGLITFYCGEFKRDGIACEWVEQGRAIADIDTKKGYLVRGEHIEAETLKEAKRINAEKRKQQALALLNVRAKRAKKAAEKKKRLEELAEYMITFEDSLNAGNCRPGTQNFKNLVEKEVGHEVNTLSLADLRKYGRMFNLTYYTDRVINYIISRK